ncbi:hypothetical protein LTR97_009501 [Elasticomyces elasticus]|uniref:Uncharacterized protein n=1 Tax=Elasticomyces elasticus TaxID=574655 RepID=A0AAN7ZS50_9PEZI|nr:hypothetical protein LTR97_009501 [Elasticomyces elasticus]
MLLNATAFRALLTGQKPPRYTIVSDEKSESTRPWAIPRRVQSLLGLLAAGILLLLLLPLRNRISSRQRAEHQAQAEKHLIIASYMAQNVSWLSEIPTAWTIKRYLMDDPSPELPGLPVPLNQGREAMAYLTYIVDHYDELPDYMIFTHGHERSWHQMEPLQMKVRALNLTALDEEDYISLRCGMQMGCEKQPYIDTKHVNWSGEDRMCEFWKRVTGERCPRYCCAQHAVTRRAIQKRSKEAWIRIREPIMHEVQDDWLSGMFYEKFWHMLLGAGPEYCPSVAKCQQVHFSNAIICDGDTDATVFEGDAWMDTKCVSAFDGLDKNAPAGPAIEEFHKELLHIYADMRGKAGERHKMQQDAYMLSKHR